MLQKVEVCLAQLAAEIQCQIRMSPATQKCMLCCVQLTSPKISGASIKFEAEASMTLVWSAIMAGP